MDLSGAKIRYLLVIYQLSREKGTARSVDIAIKLGVARPSVHRMLSTIAALSSLPSVCIEALCKKVTAN